MRWRSVVPLVLAVIVLAGCTSEIAGRPAAVDRFTVVGWLVLPAGDPTAAGPWSCVAGGRYTDIRAGADVVVTAPDGTIRGRSRLGRGQTELRASADTCVFPFTVPGIRTGERFYEIEISNRGAVEFTEAELTSPITFTLG